jgi:hypothetical protein
MKFVATPLKCEVCRREADFNCLVDGTWYHLCANHAQLVANDLYNGGMIPDWLYNEVTLRIESHTHREHSAMASMLLEREL